MKSSNFPDFCAQAFLCRWDKATTNIALMFAASVLFVHAAKSVGLLFSPSDVAVDFATAVVVTLMAVGLGILRKKGLFD